MSNSEDHPAGRGREARLPRGSRSGLRKPPRAPPPSRWPELAQMSRPADRDHSAEGVDVIVPVRGGYHATLACLESVLASANRTPFRLVVSDAVGADPQLTRALAELEACGLVERLRRPGDPGFEQAAHLAIGLGRGRDAVVLSGEALVYGDWLDRLRAHARAHPGAAMVTPFSSNAAVLSYPFAGEKNDQQLELEDAELDAMFAKANAGESTELPWPVGGCVYLTRAALEALGPIGPGDDVWRRAHAGGWRHLAALDVFVRRTGDTSLLEAGAGHDLTQLEAPTTQSVLAAARERVDLARARRLSAGRGVLMVEHGWGGGVERHVRELAGLLRREQVQSFRLTPHGEGVSLDILDDIDLPNLPGLSEIDAAALSRTIAALDLGHVHIHSLVSYPPERIGALIDAIREAGLAYDFTWHDYAPICPRLSMVDWGGIYCHSPSANYCQICVAKAGTRFGRVDVHAWRARYAGVMAGARQVFVPDSDVAARLAEYRLGVDPSVRPHPALEGTRRQRLSAQTDGAPRVVGVVGRIGPFKGSGVLLRLAGDALERNLPLRFRIYGTSTRVELGAYANVEITGAYADDEALLQRLTEDPPHLLFYPSVCPETFCYALDAAFRTGLHPVCFDIGAPARRLRAAGWGEVAPLKLALDPTALNDRLLALAIDPPEAEWPDEPARRWASADAYYGGLPRRSGG